MLCERPVNRPGALPTTLSERRTKQAPRRPLAVGRWSPLLRLGQDPDWYFWTQTASRRV